MATKAKPAAGLSVRFPEMLTLKDLITIVSIAITLTLAWGVFTTRLTVLEKDVVSLHEKDQQQAVIVEKMQSQIRRLEAHQQDDELILDQAFMLLKRPAPTRRAEP